MMEGEIFNILWIFDKFCAFRGIKIIQIQQNIWKFSAP